MPRKPKAKAVDLKPKKRRVTKMYEDILLGPTPITDPAKQCLEFLRKEENPPQSFHYGWIGGSYKRFTSWGSSRIYEGKAADGPIKHSNTACHAGLDDARGAQALFTFTPKARCGNEALGLRWTTYLLEQSPWKDVPVKLNPKFCWEKGFVIQNLDLPANLIGNFCVATRIPYEHLDDLEMWDRLVKEGVDPNTALVFASALSGNTWMGSDGGHHPLETAWQSKESIENFIRGKIAKPIHKFKDSPRYTPCNSVWGATHVPPSYEAYLKDLKKGHVKKGKRMFQVVETNSSMCLTMPFEEWAELARQESKRILAA